MRVLTNLYNGSEQSVSLTRAAEPGWQQAHYHEHVTEVYVVHEGWMAIASMHLDQDPDWCTPRTMWGVRIYQAGESVVLLPQVPHNVFLPEAALISVSKVVHHGYVHPDHHPHEELDSWSRRWAQGDIYELFAECVPG